MIVLPQDIEYWLAAVRLKDIGPITIKKWLTKWGDLKTIFSLSHAELHHSQLTEKQIETLKNPDWHSVEKDRRWCEQSDCHLIAWNDERYPAQLLQIADPPLVLYAQGDIDTLSLSQIAIVGTRHPTVTGSELAEQFAACLSNAGCVVTSGLALGIDAAAHRGALSASGKTIGVLGSGLQHIYPASHRVLAKKLIEQGVLVSLFPPDVPAKANHFPARNRVISGLSLGVLVVEAALKSGSLITTQCAIEQGREVFAIPGSIHNPMARGCHALLRQGAKLVETANDILEELGMLNAWMTQKTAVLKKEEKRSLDPILFDFLRQIGYETTSVDTMLIRSGLTAGEVSSMLLALELQGYIHKVPGGYTRTTQKPS